MVYPTDVAAALSGASIRQLAYWRSARAGAALLKPDSYEPRVRVAYSFKDIVALRTIVFLRSLGVPLQRVRKAADGLRSLGELEHLSQYVLVPLGRDVVWRMSSHEAVALTGDAAGQQIIAQMVDILGGFASGDGRRVVPLLEPAPGIQVDREIRGGYPVVAGTRVPYDLVATLVDDGVPPEEVSGYYPSVSADGACGAREFARIVDSYRHAAMAA